MGKLNTKERADTELAFCSTPELEASLVDLDRTERPRLAAYLVEFESGDLSALESALTVLKDFAADPGNAGSRIVTPQDLEDLVQPQAIGAVSMVEVHAVANYIASNFVVAPVPPGGKAAGKEPPDYVSTTRNHWTLAEAFEVLALALSNYATASALPTGVTPTTGILGPIGEPEDLVHGGTGSRTATVLEIATAATAALTEMSVTTASKPRHVPYSVTIAGSAVNSGEMLLAMALAFQRLRACGRTSDTVAVARAEVLPPYAGLLLPVYPDLEEDDLPLWYAKLQLWTVKPAPFK